MATVKIGSARIDERGRISGGKAGDQTGGEVAAQAWYRHSKGWRVLRPKDAAAAEKIAAAMERACANSDIGYDQAERNTLWNDVKGAGYDPAKTSKKVETDCSALVRVCCAYAGIVVSDFITSTEAARLLSSGQFAELTDSKYTAQSAYLRRGDVLVTKTKGHTAVVLSSGDKAGAASTPAPTPTPEPALGGRILKNGMSGADVKELQGILIQLGYSCGVWGADGDFGDATEMAVRTFQRDHGCGVDGDVGPETIAALDAARMAEGEAAQGGRTVRISGGNCYVRSAPDTSGKILGVAMAGDALPYQGQQSPDGWLLVAYQNQNGWVSGKYGRLEG